MSGCQRIDRRFAVQQVPADDWRRATQVNIAADRAAGFADAARSFLRTRPDWAEFREFVDHASSHEVADYAQAHRSESLAFLVLMLTGACDADCAICFTDRRKKKGETTPAERRRLLEEAARLGARYIYVPGEGEPTLDPGWWDFMDAVREFSLEAVVFTNGLAFGDDAVAQRRWRCSSEKALERISHYPVSFYHKLWSFDPALTASMLRVNPERVPFRRWNGLQLPAGLASMLEVLPRERVGIEVVIERRNAHEVVDAIAPFSDELGLSRIIELLQHNGRTLGRAEFDPRPEDVEAARELLSVTSCTMATCKAVVTARGFLSPRIAILEHQLPEPARIDEGSLWQLLHNTSYIVSRRYQLACLCELEPAGLATDSDTILVRPENVPPDGITSPGKHRGRTAATSSPHGRRTTVAELRAGAEPEGSVVRVVGRVLSAGDGRCELQDGPETLIVQGSSAPDRAQVEVQGNWAQGELKAQPGAVRTVRSIAVDGSLGPLPELDFIARPERLRSVVERAGAVAELRRELDAEGFLEVATPFLQSAPEMSQVSQCRLTLADGRTAFIRTDPEEYLKRYLTTGLDAVYELSTNVRDDPPDATHLREFQSLEYYRRGWFFAQTLDYAEVLVRILWSAVRGAEAPSSIRRVRVRDAVLEATGVDLADMACDEVAGLRAAIESAGVEVAVPPRLRGWRRAWIEELLDRHVCTRFVSITWLTDYPPEIALSARVQDDSPPTALRAELFLPGGLELAHVYENEVRPGILRHRYATRQAHRLASGLPANGPNEDLFRSLQVGMPPMSGGAIGVDRVLMAARGEREVGTGLLFARETEQPALLRFGARR